MPGELWVALGGVSGGGKSERRGQKRASAVAGWGIFMLQCRKVDVVFRGELTDHPAASTVRGCDDDVAAEPP